MLYTKELTEQNVKKYGKNIPYKAWLSSYVSKPNINPDPNMDMVNATTYTCKGKPRTIFSGRFCAVSGFIFAIVNGKYSVLANLRGPGTPDYQGFWNAICGYLEKCENSKEGVAREMLEECGFQIDLDDLKVIHVETEPEECNNGNVTIRHTAFLGNIIPKYVKKEGGEENEVDNVDWIPIDDIDNYKWAFNHRKTIELYAPKKWKRKIIEFYFKWFRKYNEKYTDMYDIIKEDLKY